MEGILVPIEIWKLANVLLELYYNRLFVTYEGFYEDIRNLLFPHWGRDNRGVWPKGDYGSGPLGADHFPILDTEIGPVSRVTPGMRDLPLWQRSANNTSALRP